MSFTPSSGSVWTKQARRPADYATSGVRVDRNRPHLRPQRPVPVTHEAVQKFADSRTFGRTPKIPRLNFGVAQSLGPKPSMEDRHTILRALPPLADGTVSSLAAGTSIAGVFDGHGGEQSVDFASVHLPQEVASHPLLHSISGSEDANVLEYALKSAYQHVDEKLLESASKDPKVWKDGSTALLAVQCGDALITANAGDCRAVLCRDGQAHRLTRDHTPSDPEEQRRIRMNGGRLRMLDRVRVIANGCALGVSRSLGDCQFKEPRYLVSSEPDVGVHPLSPGDSFVILASDGLWGVLSDAEAVHTAADLLSGCTVMGGKGWKASDFWANMAAKALVDEAIDRGADDNVTALVILLNWQDQDS